MSVLSLQMMMMTRPTAAPSSGLSVVQARAVNGNGSKSSVFNTGAGWATPTAGNMLIAVPVASSSGITVPSGWTGRLTSTSAARNMPVYWRISDGTESSITIGAFGSHLLEVKGQASSPFNDAIQETFSSTFTFIAGPLTPTVPNCLAIGCAAWNITNQNSFTTDVDWTLVTEGENKSFSSALAYRILDSSLDPAQVTISGAVQNSGGGSFILINPP